MNHEVQPQVKNEIEGKEWNNIPGVKGNRAAYKAFGRNPGIIRKRSILKASVKRIN